MGTERCWDTRVAKSKQGEMPIQHLGWIRHLSPPVPVWPHLLPGHTNPHSPALAGLGVQLGEGDTSCLMNMEHFRAQRLRASALDSDSLNHIPPSSRCDSGQQFLYLEGPCVLTCETGEPWRVTHQVPQGLNNSGAGTQCLVGT